MCTWWRINFITTNNLTNLLVSLWVHWLDTLYLQKTTSSPITHKTLSLISVAKFLKAENRNITFFFSWQESIPVLNSS